jgi:hypothetical protein
VLATRSFSETLQSVFGGLINRLGGEAADLPLLIQHEVNKVTLWAVRRLQLLHDQKGRGPIQGGSQA